MKRAVAIVGAIIALGAAVILMMKFSGIDSRAQTRLELGKARRTEGKMLATTLYTQMVLFQAEHGKFPTWEEFQEDLKNSEFDLSDYEFYRFGIPESDESVRAFCSDCHVSQESFKLAIYGDIDNDGEEDVITIDRGKQMVLVKDDLDEVMVPHELGSK